MSEFETGTGFGDNAGSPSAPQAPAIEGAPAAPAATPQAPAGAPIAPVDRSDWVPSYRIREAREAATRQAQEAFAQREAAIRAEADQYRSQLHRLVGASPQQDPEIDAVRQQFAQLYPGLAQMEQRAAELQGLLDRAGDLESQNSHYWQSYGRQSMDRLFEHAEKSLGAPLTDEGKRALHSSFVGFVSSSPDLTNRYANDPTLIGEFWKSFTSNFIDPARRVASATVVGRATNSALPQDSPSGAPRVGAPPRPADLDERAAQAWAHYQATAKP